MLGLVMVPSGRPWLRLKVTRLLYPPPFSGRLNISFGVWDANAELTHLLCLLRTPRSQLQIDSMCSTSQEISSTSFPVILACIHRNSLYTEPFLLLVFWWWWYFINCCPDDSPLLGWFSRNHSIDFLALCLIHLFRNHCLTLDSAHSSMPSIGPNCGLKKNVLRNCILQSGCL